MKTFPFNLNYHVYLKITELGILHYVKTYNHGMPEKYHTSYSEFKAKANEDGYHRMQAHVMMEYFGGLGMQLHKYIESNILIESINP